MSENQAERLKKMNEGVAGQKFRTSPEVLSGRIHIFDSNNPPPVHTGGSKYRPWATD